MKKYLFILVAFGMLAACGEPIEIDDSTFMKPIDFGLSVLWGSNNLGATPDHPERLGMLYAWGEIAPKDEYGWDNYQWGGMNGRLYVTKYYGPHDYMSKLLPEDDAATSFLGGKWRMPTAKEVRELIHYCNWKVETVNGVPGLKGTDPFGDGISIFFPFTDGWKDGNPPEYPSKFTLYGQYWTSEMNFNAAPFAYMLRITSKDDPTVEMDQRASGFPIRPVRDYK